MARSILISVFLFIVSVMLSSGQGTDGPLPDFILPPTKPSPVDEGGSIKLSCGVNPTMLGESCTMTHIGWWKYDDNGNPIEITESTTGIEKIYTKTEGIFGPTSDKYEKQLNFIDIQTSDERDYFCIVETDTGMYRTPHFKLIVIPKSVPKNRPLPDYIYVLPSTQPSPINEGTWTKFICGIDYTMLGQRSAPVAAIQWRKYDDNGNAIEIPQSTTGSERISTTIYANDGPTGKEYYNELSIENAQKSDERDYFCVVTTDTGMYMGPLLKLIVVQESVPKNRPLPDYIYVLPSTQPSPINEGTWTKFICGIDYTMLGQRSAPVAAIQWRKYDDNGNAIEIPQSTTGSERISTTIYANDGPTGKEYYNELSIENAQKSDERDYFCVVTTDTGMYMGPLLKLIVVQESGENRE